MAVKCVLLLTLMSLVTSLHLHNIDKEWYSFKARFNRRYSTKVEEQYRYSIFTKNFKKIYFHNLAADLGQYTYWLGVNKFADLTSEEFQRTYANLKITPRASRQGGNERRYVKSRDKNTVPRQIDWRYTKNRKNITCVTPVKDQENFKTCYAFAAAGVLESHNCLEIGDLDILSEQNIIDCSTYQERDPFVALKYAMENGLDTETSYPYQGKVGKCRESKGQLGAWVEDIEMIWPHGNVNTLKEAVADKGPVSVCIDLGDRNSTFHLYRKGVYDPVCRDGLSDLDHALLLVGYGVDNSCYHYWSLKNSYGIDWGEGGYLRLKRNDKINTCGIATFAMYPIVDPFYD